MKEEVKGAGKGKVQGKDAKAKDMRVSSVFETCRRSHAPTPCRACVKMPCIDCDRDTHRV